MKPLKVLVAAFLFALLALVAGANAALAALLWEEPNWHPTPWEYGNREYTRRHWTEFFVNYNGPDRGTGDAVRVGAVYADVFDRPETLREGQTAVSITNFDGKGDNESAVRNFLNGFDIPKEGNYWLVSPGYLRGQTVTVGGLTFARAWPLSSQSGAIYDVPIEKMPSYGSAAVPMGTTLTRPIKVDDSPVDVAGARKSSGYGPPVFWRAWNGRIGAVDLTRAAAAAMYDHSATSRAQVIASFYHNVSVGLTKVSETKYLWRIANWTPLEVGAWLRFYVKTADGRWFQLPGLWHVTVPPTRVSAGTLGEYSGFYEIPQDQRPTEDFTLVAAVNMALNIDPQGRATGAEYQPLYGSYALNGATGAPPGMGAAGLSERGYLPAGQGPASRTLGFGVPSGYEDNVATASGEGAGVPGGSGPPPAQGTEGQNDLAAVWLKVFDQNGSEVSAVELGKPYKVRARFESTFGVGGWAFVRLYQRDSSGTRLQAQEIAYFEPNGFVEREWSWSTAQTSFTLIASVAYYFEGGQWKPEKFDGKYDEAKYDNNKYERDLTGTSQPYVPPAGEEYLIIGAYHPIVYERVPVYRTEKVPVQVEVWREVPLTKEEGTGRVVVRLVE